MSKKQKKELLQIIAAAAVLIIGIAAENIFGLCEKELFSALWFVRLAIYALSYLIVGLSVLKKAVKNIAHGQVFDENFLMAIASLGAMIVGEYHEGVAVILLYKVGELFEHIAVGKTRKSIADMMDINPEFANVERENEIIEVSPDEVSVGEIIVIKPGERIPLDGEIVFGESSLNTSALTGESAPRDVFSGDEVISGCINISGLLKVRVTKPYSDSTVAKILELVENSAENKAHTEAFITKFARVYTPIVVIAAVALAVIPPLCIGIFGGGMDKALWFDWIYRALTFLVVSCPCALVISVPLSYFGGIGGASRAGIMVKGANYLEALAQAQTFVFDKTGTLTKGSFSVSEVNPEAISETELLTLCAAAESFSTHPIALSVIEAAKKLGGIPKAENAEEIAGCGVKAVVGGREILAGNARLMEKAGISHKNPDCTGTVIHCAADGAYAGYIVISDTIKDGAKDALSKLKQMCGAKTVMLTGDRKSAGQAVAKELGIDEVHTELLPNGKVSLVEELYANKPAKSSLAYIGDGINDAPSLARADVGIAMGALGSDAAIEAADIVLMNDNIESLPLAVKIARKTHGIVIQNIVFALTVKALVLIVSALGFANMWLAVFADVGVSVIAILNAMRAMSGAKN